MNKRMVPTEITQLDVDDPLRGFREEFYIPENTIYLNGNSLGLMSRQSAQDLQQVVSDWQSLAIQGWTKARPPWFYLSEDISNTVADIVGAHAADVIVTGSDTVNLHQMLATFYDKSSSRRGILIDCHAFVTDRYAIQSFLRGTGADVVRDLHVAGDPHQVLFDEQTLIARMTPDVQLAVLPSVVFHSGQLLDINRLTAAAHDRGITIGFDCSHSVGVVAHQLAETDCDFAVWCSYKYLHGGPGAVGGLYVNPRHDKSLPGLAGWFGSDKSRQFEMTADFIPAAGAGRFQLGTPHVLSMVPLLASTRLIRRAGMPAIREKSLALTAFLMNEIDALSTRSSTATHFEIVSPRGNNRGGHITVRHPLASRLSAALREQRVICDFRQPDLLRVAPSPLTTSFADCYRAVAAMEEILRDEKLQDQDDPQDAVQ